MDTLCSQAFGANNVKCLGVILQRGLLLELLLCVPIALLWGFSKHILLALGQSADVVGEPLFSSVLLLCLSKREEWIFFFSYD